MLLLVFFVLCCLCTAVVREMILEWTKIIYNCVCVCVCVFARAGVRARVRARACVCVYCMRAHINTRMYKSIEESCRFNWPKTPTLTYIGLRFSSLALQFLLLLLSPPPPPPLSLSLSLSLFVCLSLLSSFSSFPPSFLLLFFSFMSPCGWMCDGGEVK